MRYTKLQPVLSDPKFKTLVFLQLMSYGEVIVCSDLVDTKGCRVKMSFFVDGIKRLQPNSVKALASRIQDELLSAYKDALYHETLVKKLVAV